MIRLVAISLTGTFLIVPVGDTVGGAIEVGCEARASNTRLAVSVAQASGAEVVPAAEYGAPGEER